MEWGDGTREGSTLHSTPADSATSKPLSPSISLIEARADAEDFLREPSKIIQKAWEDNQELGSSTLVVATLLKDKPELKTSYVGDSGYCILRESKEKPGEYSLIYESSPQQRRFNHPYQLGWNGNGDHPKCSRNNSHDVKKGDLVILGTDGLFDNVSPDSVTDLVNKYIKENGKLESTTEICNHIVQTAYKLSLDPNHNSPFAIEAKKAGKRYTGGKSDDITVVVGKVNLKS